jgi:catechol 2,3-dioxygenase-like lactoylglutathione lyase family enzyme
MNPPAIEGVVETSLYVTDVARSVRFYCEVLGYAPIDADERITAMSDAK